MNPMSGLGALGATAPTTTAAMSGMGGLDTDAFMNLMVAQLRHQDPMAPSDANGLLQQTSVLAQTELLTQVSQLQQQLLGLQRANVATDLIGAQVDGVTADGTNVSGVVDAVRFDVTGPVLLLGDAELALDDATRIGGRAASQTTTTGA